MSISLVLKQLSIIVAETKSQNSYHAIFAYVYLRTTEKIKEAVEAKEFEDNERMQELDVYFAGLYLQAYQNHKTKCNTPQCWKIAFDTGSQKVALIQHLLAGMNAHINFDLAIATAHVMKGKDITLVKNDFNKVNQILKNLTQEFEQKLGRVSPLLFLLDWLGHDLDRRLVNFSIEKARDQSFRTATALWNFNELTDKELLKVTDTTVEEFSKIILQPKTWFLRNLLRFIARFENSNLNDVIAKISV